MLFFVCSRTINDVKDSVTQLTEKINGQSDVACKVSVKCPKEVFVRKLIAVY